MYEEKRAKLPASARFLLLTFWHGQAYDNRHVHAFPQNKRETEQGSANAELKEEFENQPQPVKDTVPPQTEQFAGEPVSQRHTETPYGEEAANRSVLTGQEPHINSEPQPKRTNPLSTAGLVCGIVMPIPNIFIGSILGILAVVFGAIAKKQGGSGTVGIITGAITLGILVLWVIILMVLMMIGATAEGTTF